MLNERKFAVMFRVFLFFLPLLSKCEILVEAKASLHNDAIKELSSNQISLDEEGDPKPEEGQIYYLPSQTVFGNTETLSGLRGVSSTLAPHLVIKPAPIQTTHSESTGILHEDSLVANGECSSLQLSQCVSETPVIELESRFLLSSRDSIKESVIMSGHLEIASKTSSDQETSEIEYIVSKPSIALQGTVLHPHSVADM